VIADCSTRLSRFDSNRNNPIGGASNSIHSVYVEFRPLWIDLTGDACPKSTLGMVSMHVCRYRIGHGTCNDLRPSSFDICSISAGDLLRSRAVIPAQVRCLLVRLSFVAGAGGNHWS
jgi:hypothetical protein